MSSRFLGRLCAFLVLVAPFTVHAEVIHSFDVTAKVEQNRNVTFEETINYDFEDLDRHGIFRFIPEKTLRDGAVYRYRYNVLDVTRDGQKEPYEVSRDNGNISIKIGDPDKTMSGSHVYRIVYSTDRAITSFKDHDELYWNVTGDQWPVNIEQASIRFFLPDGLERTQVTSSTCFTGIPGSTEQDCAAGSTKEPSMVTKRVLDWGEGFTVAFAFNKGVVRELTDQDKFWMFVKDNGILAFPIMAFVVMLYLWWTRGKDPSLQSIVPEYEAPRGLKPGVIATAMLETGVPSVATTATIIDLARRGHFKIRFDDQKKLFGLIQQFTFVKAKESPKDTLEPYEEVILDGLFLGGDEQTISDLKDSKFYESANTFRQMVRAVVDKMNLFEANPAMVRGAYIAVAILLAVGINIAFAVEPLAFISGALTGAIAAVFGWFMPRRNAEGRKLYEDILGFKMFLSVTEKDRASFHGAPERKPEQFEAFLPYAIIFHVEKQWAKQFEGMQMPPPDWTEGSMGSHFSTLALVSNLDSLHSSASSGAYSMPSSGGSGFSGGSSGGGGGGGGGGSW